MKLIVFGIILFAFTAFGQNALNSSVKMEGTIRNFGKTHSMDETVAYAHKLALESGLSKDQERELIIASIYGGVVSFKADVPECKFKSVSKLTQTQLSELKTAKPQQDSSRPNFSFDAKNKVTDVQQIFDLVSTTTSGATKLAFFSGAFQTGSVKVKFVDQKEMQKHLTSEVSKNFNAFFDPDDSTIYLNKDYDLGVLAPSFVHEATHALDPELRQQMKTCEAMKKNAIQLADKSFETLTKAEQKQVMDVYHCYSVVIFRTERKAYDAQFKFQTELIDNAPCYGKYLSAQSVNGEIIKAQLSNDDIISNKGLSPWAFNKATGYNPDIPQPPNPIEKDNAPSVH